MGEFNKEALQAGLNQLANSSTDRWDEIQNRLDTPPAPPVKAAWWSRNGLPMRVVALACCAVIIAVAGTALWQGGFASRDKASPEADMITDAEAEEFQSLSDAVNNKNSASSSTAHTGLDLLIAAECAPGTKEAILVLQNSLDTMVNGSAAVRTGAVCYADTVKALPFEKGTAHTAAFLSSAAAEQAATPALAEAIHQAVSAYAWREAAAKVLVLAAETVSLESKALQQALDAAAKRGIRIVPVITESTADETAQQLLAMAQKTGGKTLFVAKGESIPKTALADLR